MTPFSRGFVGDRVGPKSVTYGVHQVTAQSSSLIEGGALCSWWDSSLSRTRPLFRLSNSGAL